MEKQKITLDGEYTTRHAKEVRIYAVDAGGKWTVHGAFKEGGIWKQTLWDIYGTHCSFKDVSYLDLIPKKKTKKVWIVVSIDTMKEVYSYVFDSEDEVKQNIEGDEQVLEIIEKEYEI